LTGALHDLQLQLSPPPTSSLASVKPGKMTIKMERDHKTDGHKVRN